MGFKESGVKFLNYTDRKMVLILMEDKEVDGSKTGVQFGRSVRNASRKACKTIGYVYLELRGEI